MDTKKIRALLVSVEKGSLTAAASELGYTQSGLTHMMNSLEVELGLNLLLRSKSGVSLSPAGEQLLKSMEELLEAADRLEEKASRLREQSFSTLRLGAYTSVVRHWLPSVLSEFREANPDTEVSLDVGTITEIYDGIKADKLDCAVVSYQPALMQGLSWIPLRKDALVAVVPKGSGENRSAFPVEEFSGSEFLMPSACFDMDINPVFNSCPEKVCPRISYTNLDDAAIVSMVEHGLGVSILSELVMQDMSDNVKVLPLKPPASRSLGIILCDRRSGDRNIKHFVRCIKKVLGEMYSKA